MEIKNLTDAKSLSFLRVAEDGTPVYEVKERSLLERTIAKYGVWTTTDAVKINMNGISYRINFIHRKFDKESKERIEVLFSIEETALNYVDFSYSYKDWCNDKYVVKEIVEIIKQKLNKVEEKERLNEFKW